MQKMTTILSFIILNLSSVTYANDPYREFLVCVDELLEKDRYLDPKVAEDICSGLVDDTKVDMNSAEFCELFINKKK